MSAATGKGAKLVLIVTAISLLAALSYSLFYRVQHPFLTKQSDRGSARQDSQMSAQDGMERITELMGHIQENPRDVKALSELAQLFMSMRSFEQAASFWERVVRIEPERVVPRQRLAMCYYRLERYEDAANELREVLELEPDNAYAHYNMGVLALRFLDRPEKGKRHFQQILRMENADAELKERARRELSQLPSNGE